MELEVGGCCEKVSRKDILGEVQQQKQEKRGQNLYRNISHRKSVRKRIKYKVNLLDASWPCI